MTDKRIALTTCDSLEAASTLARSLLEKRCAACVNVVPGVRSFYWWEDEIQEDGEVLLVMKTDAAHLPALTEAVQELHSYDVPELVVLPIEGGSHPYLDWIGENLA